MSPGSRKPPEGKPKGKARPTSTVGYVAHRTERRGLHQMTPYELPILFQDPEKHKMGVLVPRLMEHIAGLRKSGGKLELPRGMRIATTPRKEGNPLLHVSYTYKPEGRFGLRRWRTVQHTFDGERLVDSEITFHKVFSKPK